MAYTKYSLTPASNTAAPPDGAPEGMLPSAVNDTMRDMMSQIRDCGDGIRGGTYTMTAPVITGGSVTGVTFSSSSATITGGSITGVTDIAVADGGTGASTVAAAQTNLQVFNFKNRIINGDMRIDQRNAGASVTITANAAQYITDRFMVRGTQASKLTAQQNAGSVTPPSGFINYLGSTSSSAYSVASGDFFVIEQRIEGLNVADLGWGTASAKTLTLSAWVYSSLTGTFGGSVSNNELTRSYPFSFTISSANTWTQISVTIPGDTSGTWLSTNGIGIAVFFNLGSGATYLGTANTWSSSTYLAPTGATSVVGTSGATFYITGVQLEVGSAATGFEYVDYMTQFAMCQRYFEKSYLDGTAVGTFSAGDTNAVRSDPVITSQNAFCGINFNVRKRTSPTMTAYDAAFNAGKTSYFISSWNNNGATGAWNAYQSGGTISLTGQTGAFAFSFAWIASAEL
jgi:hypothetical protein